MNVLKKVKSALGLENSTSAYLNKCVTRRACVATVADNSVWFEICNPNAEDFRRQYGVPKRHYKMSESELDLVAGFSEDDRTEYHITMKCYNNRGTLWILQSAEAQGELPPGYVKGKLM